MTCLIIEKHHAQLSYDTDVLVIREPEQAPRSIPLCRLDKLICLHNTVISTQLLGQLYQRGIDFIVLNSRYAHHSIAIYADGHGAAQRRCQQYAMQLNDAARLPLAKQLCLHKFIVSQRVMSQLPNANDHVQIQNAIQHAEQCQTEAELRGIEGSVQRCLFQQWRQLLDPAWGFNQRIRRPPPDPVNALLSLSYTLVHQEAVRQAKRYGLDPMLGIYHRLAYNRQSLACDLMEPFRPKLEFWLIDFLASGTLNRRHFSKATANGCFLGKEGRLLFYPQFDSQMPTIRRSLAATARWCAQQLSQSILPLHELTDHDDQPTSP